MDRVNGKKSEGNSRIESDVDSRAALIQMLILIALEAVSEKL